MHKEWSIIDKKYCLWQPCLWHILSQIKLHNEYFMASWTDPRESPLFWDHRLLQSPDQWAFSLHSFLRKDLSILNHTAGQQTDKEEHKNMHFPFLKRAAVNTTDFNALLSHAAVALWIFFLIASLHIPPTTFPPSHSLSPPISCLCAPCCFTLSTRHTDVSLIQATVRAGKWIWGCPFANMP